MSSQLALLLSTVFIMAVLVVDSRRKEDVSIALWLPVIWLMILASRPVAAWFSPIQQVTDLLDGGEVESPLDRNILLVLMALGVLTLLIRKLNWWQWLAENPWVFVFFLYCGVSTMWSDFPDIAFKRWVRALGALVMILIVLSEHDPIAAIGVLFRRCTYVLVPMSIVLYKYYRSMGVVYNGWTGTEYLIGVTTNKNALGRLCLISALFMLWDLIAAKYREPGKMTALNRVAAGSMFALTLWLLFQSKSSTSLGSFILGASILLVLGLAPIRNNARFLGTFLIIGALVLVGVDAVFNIKEMAVESLGRDLTLTDRTYVWQDLLALNTNPIVGVGYDSFWLGERLSTFVRKHLVAEAHSGYIEVYLELGGIGLFLIFGIVSSVFFKAKKSFMQEATSGYGRLRLAMLAIFMIYNLTEAGYKVTTFMAFTLLVVAIQKPSEELATEVATTGPSPASTPASAPAWRPPSAARDAVPVRVSAQSRVERAQR